MAWKRPPCERNGCDKPVEWLVTHDQYPNSTRTFACTDHSLWWIKGIAGIRIGRRQPA